MTSTWQKTIVFNLIKMSQCVSLNIYAWLKKKKKIKLYLPSLYKMVISKQELQI